MKNAQSVNRLLAFSLALALLLTLGGCGTPKEEDVISQEALLCCPGLQWNMTPEEVLAALGKKEKDRTVEEDRLPGEDNGNRYIFSLSGLTLFGETVDGVFAFLKGGENSWGLEYVYILFPDSCDFDAVKDALTGQLGEPSIPENENPEVHRLAWDSTETRKPYLDAVYPDLPHERIDGTPAGRVFWTDDAKWYFQYYGLTEPAWKRHHPEAKLLVFEGFVTELMQLAQAADG